MKACFIGHRCIEKTKELICSLEETIVSLINKGVKTFLFGDMSEFNSVCWEVVSRIKEKYPHIKRIYVRSAFQYINESYKEYLLKSYEETYFPQEISKAGKYAYVERNYVMIDDSTYCVFYYNQNYVPQVKRKSKRIDLSVSKRSSGTKIAYDYAIKKKKTIINLYK